MKYCELVDSLVKIGVSDAESEAELILNHLFDVNRASIVFDRGREYDADKIAPILDKREQKIPLQHILGRWYFMGREFLVSPDCLIPRPDTEILVERAIKELKTRGRVADLCTGSGCIGISMLVYRPDISSMLLCDISEKALKMAEKNALLNGVSKECTLLCTDITKGLPKMELDMIVSNPPYIPSADISTLSDEVKKEPMLALDGGDDGLDIIRFLLSEGLDYLSPDGKMLIEFGYDQGAKIDTLCAKIKEMGKITTYEIIKDYGGNDRCLLVNK